MMEQKDGAWTIQETSDKYDNPYINVREDQVVQPYGQSGRYATVEMKPGVAILPLDNNGIVYLIQQFRHPLGKESIEVVCGAIERDESPVEAALRELLEAQGIQAEEWIELGVVDVDTSIVNCPAHLFLAKQLTFTKTKRAGTETIKTVKVPLNVAGQMVMDSAITHSISCVLILKAINALQKKHENND
ncbi:NUDIX domain-containing protein [Microseira wollei]|uniref:Nudix/MutT family protein, putative n=1 Tax=Microseira wollei NIES-4236 TaxID=2530354 RepID=A0AAV3XJS0_9CYAN|nr:NUDIX hydrolase [Microseira wollei]GET40799.1 Nudix/MutT family protein, putative [Microseira wollei NIES-4236]